MIVRETSEAAWAAADELISHVTDETIAKAQKSLGRYDSVGQQRMAALHGWRRDKLEVSPNLWAGVGLVRGGAGTALVGNPEEVAARIKEYADLASKALSLAATRTWKNAIAWPNWCFRCCRWRRNKAMARCALI